MPSSPLCHRNIIRLCCRWGQNLSCNLTLPKYLKKLTRHLMSSSLFLPFLLSSILILCAFSCCAVTILFSVQVSVVPLKYVSHNTVWLLLMRMVNISIQKYLSACIALSLSHLQFPLFLHFHVLVQQSQVLPSLLTIEHEKLGEKCSYLPDGCFRTAGKSKNSPTWGSNNYKDSGREWIQSGWRDLYKII